MDAIVNDSWTLDGKQIAAGTVLSLTDEEFADYSAKGFVRAANAPAPADPDVEHPIGWVGRHKAPRAAPAEYTLTEIGRLSPEATDKLEAAIRSPLASSRSNAKRKPLA